MISGLLLPLQLSRPTGLSEGGVIICYTMYAYSHSVPVLRQLVTGIPVDL